MPENNEMSRVSQKKNKKQNGTGKKKQQKKKIKGSLFKKILLGIVAFIVLVLVAGAGLFFYYAKDAPEMTMDDLMDSESTVILAANGNEIHTTGGQDRELVEANEIPQVLVDAVLSIEDQRFYNHIGVDPIRIAGAAVSNITDGFASAGGSTITQQLVKLSVFSTKTEDQTLERKAQEAWLALQLERQLSKEQILTLYINKVYMSDNQYGMGTAAEYYYGKHVSELELHEAALLAGMSQAPNAYNPYTNPEQATERRDLVLYMMYENEKISEEEKNTAQEIPITEGLVEQTPDEQNNSTIIDNYLTIVYEEVEEKTGLDPFTAGLTIQTNLDMDAQQKVYDVLNSGEYGIFPNDEIQTAVTVVDVNTGQLKAVVGNRKAEGQLTFNHAQQTQNIGSTIKPLSTYGPAIEYLDYSTYHQIDDEPTTFSGGMQINNWDRAYKGQISMREALVDSRNIPTYKLYRDVGKEKVEEFLASVGLPNYGGDDGAVESASFNGFLSPVDLAGSYASFANGGQYTEPYTVSNVTTADGEEIDLTPSTTQAMKDSTAYMVTDMLKDAASTGTTGNLVSIPGVPQAGKTGTGNYSEEQKAEHNIPNDVVPDSAYVGYTSNYSVSVWTGYANKFEQGNWLSNTDGTRLIPRKVYREVMAYLSQSVENADWSMPNSVVEVGVVDGSRPASLPGPNTPSSDIVTELFVRGTQPTSVSEEYEEEEEVELPAPTGLSASYDEETNEINVTWDEYSAEDVEGAVSYVLTVGDQTATTSDTQHVVTNPAEGSVEVSLIARVGDQSSPAATVQVTVSSSEEENEEENEDEESEESESSETSESSSESSSSSEASSSSQESSSESSSSSEANEENSSDENAGSNSSSSTAPQSSENANDEEE